MDHLNSPALWSPGSLPPMQDCCVFPFDPKPWRGECWLGGRGRNIYFCGCWNIYFCDCWKSWLCPALPCSLHPPVRASSPCASQRVFAERVSWLCRTAQCCRIPSDCFTSPSCCPARVYPALSRACPWARPGFCSPWTGRVSPTDGTAFLSYFAQSLKTFR